MIVPRRSISELPLAEKIASWNAASAAKNASDGFSTTRMTSSASPIAAIASVSALRGVSGRSWLDRPADLDQVVEELQRHRAGRVPGDHVGIEQVPAAARQDMRAGAATGGDQALGAEHLERLAHRLAAGSVTLGEFGLPGQQRPLGNGPRNHQAPDLVGDLPMDTAEG